MQWFLAAKQFSNALAADEPTPGGGAAAAMAGSMGCALLLMALGTTLKRKNTPAADRDVLKKYQRTLQGLHATLQQYIEQDADAYGAYVAACRLPKENPARPQAVQDALWLAACVPADTAAACQRVLEVLTAAEEKIAPVILSDVFCARHLLSSAEACCMENIRTNLSFITDTERAAQLARLLESYESSRK